MEPLGNAPPQPQQLQPARPDLDPALPLQPAPSQAEPSGRALFAAQHPFLYLFVLAVFTATAAVAVVVLGGMLAHVVVRGVVWAWGLA